MSGNPLFDSLARASTMGLHFISGMLVGGAIGYGLDSWLGTAPWGLGFFFLCGIAAGFRNVWLDARRLIRESEAIPSTSAKQAAKSEQEKHHTDGKKTD